MLMSAEARYGEIASQIKDELHGIAETIDNNMPPYPGSELDRINRLSGELRVLWPEVNGTPVPESIASYDDWKAGRKNHEYRDATDRYVTDRVNELFGIYRRRNKMFEWFEPEDGVDSMTLGYSVECGIEQHFDNRMRHDETVLGVFRSDGTCTDLADMLAALAACLSSERLDERLGYEEPCEEPCDDN